MRSFNSLYTQLLESFLVPRKTAEQKAEDPNHPDRARRINLQARLQQKLQYVLDNPGVRENLDFAELMTPLPENLKLKGYINLNNNQHITTIPRGMSVKRFLIIRGSNVETISNDVEVTRAKNELGEKCKGVIIAMHTPFADKILKQGLPQKYYNIAADAGHLARVPESVRDAVVALEAKISKNYPNVKDGICLSWITYYSYVTPFGY